MTISLVSLLDLVAYAFPSGWLLARLGCALVHDHPGTASSAALAVAFPGGSRYDLGVLELLLMVPLAIAAIALGRLRGAGSPGRLAAVVAGSYPAMRFPI